MASPTLPLELLQKIIDDLDVTSLEDYLTLCTFSLVGRPFSYLCQKRIFQDVKLSYSFSWHESGKLVLSDSAGIAGTKTTGHLFRDLLASSPHLAILIRSLTISVSGNLPASHHDPGPSSAADSFSLYDILPRLQNLEAFMIAFQFYQISRPWNATEERTQSLFKDIIPRVSRLDLSIFEGLPTSLFSDCPKLKELHAPFLFTDSDNISPPPAVKANIQVLEVQFQTQNANPGVAFWSPASNSPFSFSHLRSLKLSRAICSPSQIDELLLLCSGALEELDLHSRLPEDIQNLAKLRKLRRLRLHPKISGGNGMFLYNSFPYILTTLKTLPWSAFHPKQLALTLQATVLAFPNSEAALPMTLFHGWSDVANFLTDSGVSPTLANVDFVSKRPESYPTGFKEVHVPLSEFTPIWEKNVNLRKMREEGRLTYRIEGYSWAPQFDWPL
ncbi:hypothetical protein CVT26_004736 [Gymnopilus dilepis]|uniref:F-box domain-containing protein n=1 Tax=Gymnopilus dilepis TaxID=231916 RepID=A0A409XZ99_9AGAR|nr:hypothetical protein CVT26_004736 [Gymnopilus dilepis]